MARKEKNKKEVKGFSSFLNNQIDFTLLITILLLLSIGLIMVLSASAPSSLQKYGNSYKFFEKQLIFAVAGVIAMWFISKIDYRIYQRFYWLAYGVSILLLVAVLAFGSESHGYEFNTTGRQKWAAGLVFAPSLQISHDNSLTYSNSSTSDNLDKSYHSRTQYLPMHIGSGVSMTTERWVVTADYNYLDWSRNTSSYTSMKYENQHKMNIGGIYATNPRYPRSTELMGGVGFSNSYINLRGGKMKYLEVSAGASFPIRYSYLSLGATWRKQINSRSSLMQESRFSVNLNLTFGERISRAKLK